MRKWCQANPEKVRATRLKSKFGLSPEEYEMMIERQGGVCPICDTQLPHHLTTGTGKAPGATWSCVDHDHSTGAVRGLLCNLCNNGLGMFKDNIQQLERAIAYLNKTV
jgi:hypothetical protein